VDEEMDDGEREGMERLSASPVVQLRRQLRPGLFGSVYTWWLNNNIAVCIILRKYLKIFGS
jgi:hypothetical protein